MQKLVFILCKTLWLSVVAGLKRACVLNKIKSDKSVKKMNSSISRNIAPLCCTKNRFSFLEPGYFLYTLPYVCFSRFGFLFIDLGKLTLHRHDV